MREAISNTWFDLLQKTKSFHNFLPLIRSEGESSAFEIL